MLCTAAEIEEKKRRAKEKLLLKRKQLGPIAATSNPNLPANTSPKFFPKPKTFPSTSRNFDNSPKRRNDTHSNSMHAQTTFNQKLFADVQTKIEATCVLMHDSRFKVKFSKFFQPAIDAIKTVPSRKYDPKTCTWDFSLEHYDSVVTKLDQFQSHLQVVKFPLWIHKLRRKNTEVCYDFSMIDEKLRNTLMPFQEEALCYAIERNGRCLLGDEMGLGKTIQALAIAAYYRHDWPILIATVASTCANWESTICKYLPSIPIMNIQVLGQKSDYMEKPTVVIASYDMMSRRIDDLIKLKFGVCIFDESHTLKNFKTKCFKAAQEVAKAAPRVLLLSGTPALSKPSELFTQLQLIDDAFFGNFMDYSKRYCDGKESPYGWVANGQSNLDELQSILEQRFMIRRTKDSMGSLELPEKTQEIVHLNITPEHLNIEERRQLDALNKTDFKAVIKNTQQILPFFHTTAQIKVPAVTDYVRNILKEEKRKVIIFAHHMVMLNAVESVLKESKKDFIRIDGKTSDRANQVQLFQRNSKYVCALLSICAANSGITLTAAEIVIFAELHWTPSILAQAEARAHRIGQTKPVTIRYLIGSKTVDDYIWPLLQNKQRTLKGMKLTADSYDNFKTVTTKAPSPNSPKKQTNSPRSSQQHITQFFSPSPERKRNRQECGSDQEPQAKIHKNDNTDILPNQTNSSAEFEDDADIDDFFCNFSTQQMAVDKSADTCMKSMKSNVFSDDEDIFDDGMDDFLKAIPL